MCADLFDDDADAEDSLTQEAKPGGRQYHCPTCKQLLRLINGRKGPFWGCSGFPACTTSLFDKDGKPSEEPDERFRCPVCTRSLVKASNEHSTYWYCIGYNRGCKVTLADVRGVPEEAHRCRRCGQLLKRRKGAHGYFWGCTRYPDCRQTYPDVEGRPVIP